MSGLAGPDPLRNAYGVVDFEILADPKQPRVRAVHIETADGRTFTFAIRMTRRFTRFPTANFLPARSRRARPDSCRRGSKSTATI